MENKLLQRFWLVANETKQAMADEGDWKVRKILFFANGIHDTVICK